MRLSMKLTLFNYRQGAEASVPWCTFVNSFSTNKHVVFGEEKKEKERN